jgi:hypothetical protein
MPQPLNLTGGGGGTLLVHCQTRTRLQARPCSVVLEVEQVLCVPGQRSHPGVEMRALEVGHSLKALLPYEILLISNREKRDRQCCYGDEVVLAQGGEGDVCHHLNASVGLATNDGPRPWLRGVKGYHHANLTPVQAVDSGQSTTIDQSVPIIAKMDECII